MADPEAVSDLVSWLVGFGPGLLWLWWIHRKDVREPEPLHFVLGTYTLGVLAALAWLRARAAIDANLDWAHEPLLDAFVVTAAGEELVKLLAFLPAFLHDENDEPLDGVVYGTAAGLGFASLENVLFVQMTGSALLGLERAFTALLVHVACSGSLGYWLGCARFARGAARWRLAGFGLGAAVVCHGLFDVLLAAGDRGALFALLGLLPLLLFALSLQIRLAQSRSGRT